MRVGSVLGLVFRKGVKGVSLVFIFERIYFFFGGKDILVFGEF